MLHRILTLTALAVLALVPRATAGPVFPVNCVTAPCIDFGALTSSGTVSYAGGFAPLLGDDIRIEAIWGFGTPDHNLERLDIVNGVLTFTTGAFVGYDPIAGYEFAGGGTFLIQGQVPDVGITMQSTLAEGTFFSAFFGPGVAPASLRIFGIDAKHDAIVSYFGLVPGLPFHFGGPLVGGPSLTTVAAPGGGAFSVEATSVDIPNTPVPEPGTFLLMLCGGGAVLAARMRRRQSPAPHAQAE
jgi:hypothetical protein